MLSLATVEAKVASALAVFRPRTWLRIGQLSVRAGWLYLNARNCAVGGMSVKDFAIHVIAYGLVDLTTFGTAEWVRKRHVQWWYTSARWIDRWEGQPAAAAATVAGAQPAVSQSFSGTGDRLAASVQRLRPSACFGSWRHQALFAVGKSVLDLTNDVPGVVLLSLFALCTREPDHYRQVTTFAVSKLRSRFLDIFTGWAGAVTLDAIFRRVRKPKVLARRLTMLFGGLLFLWNGVIRAAVMPYVQQEASIEPGTPIFDGIQKLTVQAGVPLDAIVIVPTSPGTTECNAMTTGLQLFGPIGSKRVELFDTIVKLLTPEELTAIVAHEFGHVRLHHLEKEVVRQTLWYYFYSIACTKILYSPAVHRDFGYDAEAAILDRVWRDKMEEADHEPEGAGVAATMTIGRFNQSLPSPQLSLELAFELLYPFYTIFGVVTNVIARRSEYAADKFASDLGYGAALIAALKKIDAANNTAPSADADSGAPPVDWLYDMCLLDHPTTPARAQRLEMRSQE